MPAAPLIGLVMGSDSDWETLAGAAAVLQRFRVPFECGVRSAHRTPERMFDYARTAEGRGLRLIIAAAGGAAHLPGMIAALTPLPVLGVPVATRALSGVDSLLSIVQMPAGVPTATFAIGPAGATNAAIFALRVLAATDARAAAAVRTLKAEGEAKALEGDARVRALSGAVAPRRNTKTAGKAKRR